MSDTYHPIETEPWETVKQQHEARLTDQLAYLQDSSNYYQSKFSEWGVDPTAVQSLEEFRNIPFTTKDDERRNQENPSPSQPLGAHQAVPTSDLNRTISSSGTTGKPTYFGLTEADRQHWNEVIERCFYTAGFRPEDTVIFGVGQTMVPGGAPYFEALTQLGANVVPAGGGTTDRLLAATTDLFADVMFTTTSHLRYLTEEAPDILNDGVDELPVSKLVGGGGPGIANPEIRQTLYKKWDAESVREVMGLGDVIGCMWAECEAEDGMHYCAQGHAHVELIDPETETVIPFEEEKEGELVYTPLGREATPLLRYRSGDFARVTGTSCSCGRTSPKIQCIGRVDDMIIYKGMNVFPSALRDVISEIDGAMPHVRVVLPEENQVHFEDPIPVNVVIEPDTDRDEADIMDEVVTTVRTKLKVQINPNPVSIDEVELAEYKSTLVTEEE